MEKNNAMLIWTLSAAVFGVITTELGTIGLLPQIMQQLRVDATEAGYLVSLYAMVVAITGPFVTLFLSRYNKKTVLVSIMSIFVVSNIIYALTSNFPLMLVFRIIPAFVHAAFFSVALVVATNTAAPEKKAGAAAKVFAGVALGLVLGVPISAFIAGHASLSAAFLFAAVANAVALVGIVIFVPHLPADKSMSYSDQIGILRSGKLWLAISTVMFVFAAMFSGFSYISDFLGKVPQFDDNMISVMLIVFGLCGFAGNFLYSHLLQRNMLLTTLTYPAIFAVVYLAVFALGASQGIMWALLVVWGVLHSSGLVVSQHWLTQEAQKAQEFANSLYMSFSNLGITVGALVGGWFIAGAGPRSVVLSGALFAALAFLSILWKIALGKSAKSVAQAG